MPYIIFPEHNLKFLIDSGSTKSFIDPDIAHKFYQNFIAYDPFIVSTVFQKSADKYSASIPSSEIFNLPKQRNLKFYLFKFHNIFNGLIGLDNLKLLQANLDFNESYFITPYIKIKLLYHNTSTDLNLISILPRSEQVIKIETSILDGEVIIPHKKFHNCEIPESLTIAKNGQALTTILNSTTKTVNLDFFKPIQVEKFDSEIIEQIDLNNFDDCSKYNLDLSKIRTDYLNSEEKSKNFELCKEFSDIFYQENMPLSFTSKVKHQVRTVDEIPVYTKSNRYPFIHKKEVEIHTKETDPVSDEIEKIIELNDGNQANNEIDKFLQEFLSGPGPPRKYN